MKSNVKNGADDESDHTPMHPVSKINQLCNGLKWNKLVFEKKKQKQNR